MNKKLFIPIKVKHKIDRFLNKKPLNSNKKQKNPLIIALKP